jgi:hypothetical protein
MMVRLARRSKEVVMPYHWWLIEGDNPGPKQRSAAVRKAVDDLPNVECRFVGWEPDARRWYALVWVDPKASDDELRSAKEGIKVRRSLKVLESFD